jgi:quinol monooxygenase YgiN
MTQLTIFAKIRAKSGSEIILHRELSLLIEPTLLEIGCLNYDLYHSLDDCTLFMFHENWVSRNLWDQHMTSQHMSEFQKNTEKLIESLELLMMTPEDQKLVYGNSKQFQDQKD